MTQPQINEKNFQAWLLNHASTLMFGTSQIDAVRLLYSDAFAHGWYGALELAEKSHSNLSIA
jgi:hypothetical protein